VFEIPPHSFARLGSVLFLHWLSCILLSSPDPHLIPICLVKFLPCPASSDICT
jgi:hypothetical protein